MVNSHWALAQQSHTSSHIDSRQQFYIAASKVSNIHSNPRIRLKASSACISKVYIHMVNSYMHQNIKRGIYMHAAPVYDVLPVGLSTLLGITEKKESKKI